MTDTPKQFEEIERLAQEIINKFETVLNSSTTSELSFIINDINKALEKQASLIQNISLSSTDRLKQTQREYEIIKDSTDEIIKQSQLYKNILSINDDITDNWDEIIKKSAYASRNYKELNKQQKDYLTTLNATIKKEKQLNDLTYKRLQAVSKANKSAGKAGGIVSKSSSNKIPQFVDVQGLSSSQIILESLTGGRPYFASHPEMGVPLGLFNTKDEPTRAARIKAIEKYGPYGSIAGLYPQYAKPQLPVTDPNTDVEPSAPETVGLIIGKIIAKKTQKYFEYIMDIIDIVTKLGDKFQDYAGEADEAIRSAIQGAGTMMAARWEDMFKDGTPINRAAYFQQSMEKAARELNIEEGVYASYEMLSNLQKAFTQYSKTNVLLGKEDLKNMIYVQRTFDIAADDVADIQSAFMEIGLSSQDMLKYTDDLAREARKYGVSATQLLKETAKLMRAGVQYRFRGGVKDFEKMQIYAANAKFDIERAYNVMDKSLSIEGAVELASQLQVLGGEFANISSLELFQAAQSGDMTKFVNSIIERLKRDYGRFGRINEQGMFEFSTRGIQLLRAFEHIEGFDLGEDIKNIIIKAAKEDKIREKILSSEKNREKFLSFSEEEQRQIIENIAQGSVNTLNLTGQSIVDEEIDFAKYVLDTAADQIRVGAESAKGAQSVKDQIDLNVQIAKLESQQVDALNKLKDGLVKLKDSLEYAGKTIATIGKEYFKLGFFKKMEVLTDYLGVTLEEALLFHDYFKINAAGENEYAGLLKGGMLLVADPLKFLAKFAEDSPVLGGRNKIMKDYQESADALRHSYDTLPEEKKNWFRKFVNRMNAAQVESGLIVHGHYMQGGILQAGGGIVIGNSHLAGGVRGTGRFNNVEVEGGEAIINKKSTQMFLPLLSKLNELGGGVKFDNSSGNFKFFNNILNSEKTINIKISGGLNFKDKQNKQQYNLIEIAESLDEITNGQSYGGVY